MTLPRGPGRCGKFHVVQQAVAPNYKHVNLYEGRHEALTQECVERDALLRKVYVKSFERVKEAGCTVVALPILAGLDFRGDRLIEFVTETMV